MKKFVALTLSTLMMCSSVFANGISVNLNGENVEFSNQSPVIVEGRTLIPLRGVFEKLGYEISWDNETKTATFTKENTVVKVTVNANNFTINDGSVNLDVPAQIVNGSMMLPLRAVGEATGLKVDWDNDTKTVKLNSESDGVFSFGDDGKATIKSKEQVTTEATTETTTEAVKNVSKVDLKLTADQKKYASEYIEFIKTVTFCDYYSTVMGNYIDEFNSYTKKVSDDDFIALLEETIAVNNQAKTRLMSDFKSSGANHELITALNNTITRADSFFSLMLKNFKDEHKKSKWDEHTRNSGNSYSDAMKKMYEIEKTSIEEYSKDLGKWDWGEDNTTEEERKEIMAYESKVEEIIERNTESEKDISFSNSRKNSGTSTLEALLNNAQKIKNEIANIETPERCKVRTEVLLESMDLLKDAYDIIKDRDDNSVDVIYPTALIYTYYSCLGYYTE
ncbi:MAG: copper amine oxidase N-terminal domain-containing protein [Lachnospirales bacterium]